MTVSPLLAARVERRPAALLLPLTGDRAALGRSMQQAAMLVESDAKLMRSFDTAGTPAGAAHAAQEAMRAGAGIVLGPLSTIETAAAAGVVAGKVPVLAFTNDVGAQASGAFVLGITPAQATAAILTYARSRGVRRVLVVADGSAWSQVSATAATALQGEIGLSVSTVTLQGGAVPAAAGDPPDAVFVPGGSPAVLAAARNLRDSGVQLLATVQGIDHRPEALAALDGAWIASPDPERFATFASAFSARNGGRPGAIAALAHDAALVARTLRQGDLLNREGVLSERGFDCVTGPLRFRSDGSCARTFAILVARPDRFEKVAESRGA